MTRRVVVLGGLAMANAATAAPVSDGQQLSFRIMRKGSVIGSHVFDFARHGDALTAKIAVDIAVSFGFITLYRYSHNAVELWRDDEFTSIDARSNDNGTRTQVSVRREDAGLVVERSSGPGYVAPANALPATHWNRRMLSGPLINNQTGELMRPSVTSLGFETITLVSGIAVRAEHLELRGDVDMDTWYDSFPSWVGLRFTGKDGDEIRYERM